MSDETPAGRDKLEIDNMFLCGSRFTRVSLKNSSVVDAHMMATRFENVDATGMVFENANLGAAIFHDVNMAGASINYANLDGLAITNCNVTDMTIDGIPVADLLAAYDRLNRNG